MAEFSELIKSFDKIRDYMRDFYVYGFKTRADFTQKSARTYDNEKRRCESYLGEYMKWDYSGGNKTSFISVNCARIPVNPLYSAWKSKSFTSNDIMLHFYILDALKLEPMDISQLTDEICERSGMIFDVQTIRNKCREYARLGLLECRKKGRAIIYGIAAPVPAISGQLINAIKFYQGALPFGEIGSYMLDNERSDNDLFVFKHHYIAHTLEDGVLFELLRAMRLKQTVMVEYSSKRSNKTSCVYGLPLKILVGTATGRRYVCLWLPETGRIANYRLDYIKTLLQGEKSDQAIEVSQQLTEHLDAMWGVSAGFAQCLELVCVKLHIDAEGEAFILERIAREGQGGELLQIDSKTFLFTKQVTDSSDISPWIKTFTGRIIALEGTNKEFVGRFYDDMKRMAQMYGINSVAGGVNDGIVL